MITLDESTLAKLAGEMVRGIRNPLDILADFQLTEAQYDEIEKKPFYAKIKEFIQLEWNSTSSNADRIKYQGQAGFELLMPVLIRRAMDPMTPLAAANETGKLVAKVAGVGETAADSKPNSERFVITINLGADVDGKEVVETFNKSIEINPDDVNLGGSSGKAEHEGPQETARKRLRAPREGQRS